MKRWIGLIGLGALTVLIAAGCGGQRNPLLAPHQPPEVELFAQRVTTSTVSSYEYRLQWVGRAGGRIDHYLIAIGGPGTDSRSDAWTATTEREHVMSVPSRRVSPARASIVTVEPSVFSVRAVDGHGLMSAPAQRAFFDSLPAPQVTITSPVPNPLIRFPISSNFCVEWMGTAFDANFQPIPVAEFKYILLTDESEVPIWIARTDPDSVRRYYAAHNWQGWVTNGQATSAALQNLTLDKDYVFVVTGFDRAGNYDPIFSFSKNMLYMRVAGTAASLPVLNVVNQYIHYSAPGFNPSPVNVQIPAGQALTFDWFATAVPGRKITGYRWALDLANPAHLAGHWSQWGLATTSTTVGPFRPAGPGPETHTLSIEARDDWGCSANDAGVSLVVLELIVIQPTFNHELLIVDDTRLVEDRILVGTACSSPSNAPVGPWPTAAELDTFLYARGGVPWRCYPPVGGQPQLSSSGVFSGYAFDTLGTRIGMVDLTVPLSTLSQYRHVIWLTDARAALNFRIGTSQSDPQTAMRYMNAANTTNTLAAYVRQGGSVWLAGGGAATASLINFNKQSNDNNPPNPRTLTFSSGYTFGELVPGRFIYDQAHWRSEFKQYRVNNGRIRRYLGRMEGSPGIYAGLPAEIALKTPATDPFPPNRVGQAPGVFYQQQFDIEFLSQPNEIVEDLDHLPRDPVPHPVPRPEGPYSTLDSLYKATATSLQPDTGSAAVQSVVMTYYHSGADNPPFVLTGFNLWSFRRSDSVALVDFVLQQLWGMARGASASVSAAPARGNGIEPVAGPGRPQQASASAGAAGVARRN